MSDLTKPGLLDMTGQDMVKALNMIAVAQASNAGQVESWATAKQLVRQGLGPKAFPVGTRRRVTHSDYGGGTILMDVMGHDIYPDPTGRLPHTMLVLMHDCIYGRMIDNSELLWANNGTEALAAGTYHFTLLRGAYGAGTLQDGTYQFTITQPIPVGGGFRHTAIGYYQSNNNYTKAQITGGTITTYNESRAEIESALATTEGSGGVNLGTASRNWADTAALLGAFNSVERQAYGSNNHDESGSSQWLNSSMPGGSWYTQKTIFDMPPSYASTNGFLRNIDPEFADALVAVDVTTIRNTAYEIGGTMGGSYVTREKVFPLSMTEMGYGNNNGIAEGSVLPFYDGATNADRIKYDVAAPTTARYVWVRSPYPSNANLVRIVYPSGALSSYYAYIGYGLAAAGNIG